MKVLPLFFILYSFCLYGNSDDTKNKKNCFRAFLNENYNETSMTEHLSLIKERGYPEKLSDVLLTEFDKDTDFAFRGMIGRVLGENRLARKNKKKVVSLMIQTVTNRDTHYLERKGMVQGLGHLLKPEDKKEIRELSKALEDSSSAVRKETAISLGRIKPKDEKEIEKKLIKMVNNTKEKDFVREAAVEALGEIISPGSFNEIWKIYDLLTDTNPNIRKVASSALRKIDSNIYTIVQSLDIQELYQRHIEEQDKQHYNAPKPFGSWFAVRVFLAIHKKGYFVIPEFEFAANKTVSYTSGSKPYRIDLVIIGPGGKKLAVECDGRQHEYNSIKEKDAERQKELENFGWEFWRISQKSFYSQPDQTLEKLWKKLDEIGIQPFLEEKKKKFSRFWKKRKK